MENTLIFVPKAYMIIALSGYMGAGKTSLGRELARRLQWDFVDLDDFITHAFGESPAEIIRRYGERALRIAENQALNQLLTERDNLVLALGGGTITEAFNQRLVDAYTFHVFVDTPWDKIKRHLSLSPGDRPLWQKDMQERKQHYRSRLPAYRRAHLVFSNEYDTPAEAAHALIKLLPERS